MKGLKGLKDGMRGGDRFASRNRSYNDGSRSTIGRYNEETPDPGDRAYNGGADQRSAATPRGGPINDRPLQLWVQHYWKVRGCDA